MDPALLSSITDHFKEHKRTIKRLRKLRSADVVVVSFPKSGRTWLAVMISHLYHQKFNIDQKQIIKFDNFHRINDNIPDMMFTHDNRKTSKLTPLAPLRCYKDKKVILLTRDPRDVVVSAYFHSTRRRLPKRVTRSTAAQRAKMASVFAYTMEIELAKVIDFLNYWEQNIKSIDRSLLVRYEDLRARPCAELARVAEFIGGGFSAEAIENAVRFASFENLREKERARFFETSRLHPGDQEDPDSFKARRGKVGGYRDYFTAEELDQINTIIANELSETFGYRHEISSMAAERFSGSSAG